MSENPLVSFGDLGKPIKTLIERESDAVGGLFAPWQTRRVARAEADAALIQAESEIRVTELHREAFWRSLEEEVVKQANMENIVRKAIPHVDPDNANPEDVTRDWFANFFDRCRIVSDEDMQQLWARILAGEANNPGSFSRRTVNLMADLDKRDAVLFSSLCRFVWTVRFDQNNQALQQPLIYDYRHDVYNQLGINFGTVGRLESLGLIHEGGLTGFSLKGLKGVIPVYYGGKWATLTPLCNDGKGTDVQIGGVLFSPSGAELFQICEVQPVDGFFEYVYDRWVDESLVPPRG